MPNACVNCVRFHYGPCREPTRQCRVCDGHGHIERYCPNNKVVIRRVSGEPLPGTREWCEFHGLNNDPDLRRNVLQALKSTPSSAITINGACIYQGNHRNFDSYQDLDDPRGRPLKQRITRRRDPYRSVSPARDRQQPPPRSPSPGGRGRTPPYGGRYRSRSPIRQRRSPSPYRRNRSRTPSPYRQAAYNGPRSPRYASGSNAVVFEARAYPAENQPPQPGRLAPPFKFNLPPRPAPLDASQASAAEGRRVYLGNLSSMATEQDLITFFTGYQVEATTFPKDARYAFVDLSTPAEAARAVIELSGKEILGHPVPVEIARQADIFNVQPSRAPLSKGHQIDHYRAGRGRPVPADIEDPYFILGIDERASEADIIIAYQNQMYEIDLQRITAGIGASNTNNIWHESIQVLNDAKRQLLGY